MVIFTQNLKKKKMKYAIFFIGIALFVSCSEEEKSTKVEANKGVIERDTISHQDTLAVELPTLEDTVITEVDYSILVQSPMFFLPEEVVVLQQYFTDSSIIVYDSCQALLADAKTDLEFGNAYLKLLAIRSNLSNQIYSGNYPEEKDGGYYPDYIINDLKPIDEAVFGMQFTCVAECTDFDFTFDLTELKPLVLNTSGDMDDILFQLFDLADGDYGGTADGWHNWFERTWDYGGGSLFGSGMHLEILEKIHELKSKTNMYDELINKYQSYLLMDIQHGIYMRTQAETTVELKNILHLEYLTSEEKAPLQLLLGNWEKGDGSCKNCVDGTYQFGCATGDCNWGG